MYLTRFPEIVSNHLTNVKKKRIIQMPYNKFLGSALFMINLARSVRKPHVETSVEWFNVQSLFSCLLLLINHIVLNWCTSILQDVILSPDVSTLKGNLCGRITLLFYRRPFRIICDRFEVVLHPSVFPDLSTVTDICSL